MGVQRFTPLPADAARIARHAPGDLASTRRDAATARRFFQRSLATLKVNSGRGGHRCRPDLPGVLEELLPAAWHHFERHANNPIEADHSKLKHRLKPMRGLRTDRTAQVIIAGHAFMRDLRRGHYELGVDVPGFEAGLHWRSPSSPERSD